MSDPLRAELESAAADLVVADSARAEALARISAALKRGEGEIPIREMARLAGISHVTAYRLLEK